MVEKISRQDYSDAKRILNILLNGDFEGFYQKYKHYFSKENSKFECVDDLLEAGGYYSSGQEVSFEEAIREGLTVFATDLKISLIQWIRTI